MSKVSSNLHGTMLIVIKFEERKRGGERDLKKLVVSPISKNSGIAGKKFKHTMSEKMRLNVVDSSDPALISKKFWRHVKSQSKSTRIPETIKSGHRFRKKAIDKANLFNEYFYSQFSEASSHEIDIEMNNYAKGFMDLRFHVVDVLLILKELNPSKAAGPDGIDCIILKNCAASIAKPLTLLFNASFVTGCLPDE